MNRTCIKCGYLGEHTFKYLPPGDTEYIRGQCFTGECLIVRCTICGYATRKPTADQSQGPRPA